MHVYYKKNHTRNCLKFGAYPNMQATAIYDNNQLNGEIVRL
jgi:hypothetical protein